ncbi:methionine ABC transporter ATP-binding protein [Levilactobacillus brevis]|nr:methionine ABC transporter ATP-binding protein [Levilactobacillus brevis]
MAIIQLKDIDVTFHNKGQTVTAVKNVSLTVNRGDIYGVVGYSGAGKSTLVRVINRLQQPTAGTVEVNGQDILGLPQLSGGQKQRVAIARALANDPEILISDEATSALDPKTTSSILELLKRLNQELGLTVVLITHEMEAVKEICNKVAVMDAGEIIERGDLVTIFSQPHEKLTQDFINTATQINQALTKIYKQAQTLGLDDHQQLVQLQYVGASTDAPLITELYKRFEVVSNILYGNVEILQDTPLGNLIVVMTGAPDKLAAAWQYCQSAGITVTHLQPTDPEVA